MWCDYCLEYHRDTKKVYRYEIEEYVDLYPDCASEDELETCDCGHIATHDGINIIQIVTNDTNNEVKK